MSGFFESALALTASAIGGIVAAEYFYKKVYPGERCEKNTAPERPNKIVKKETTKPSHC